MRRLFWLRMTAAETDNRGIRGGGIRLILPSQGRSPSQESITNGQELLKRYNPIADMSEEEKIHATARRVGMDVPLEYKPDRS